MTDTTSSARSGSAFTSPAALLGAGVLVAALGATAGWMIHSKPAAPEPAATMALAPNEAVVAPAPAASELAAASAAVTAAAPAKEEPKPAPVHHAPSHKPATRSPVVAANEGTATGSTAHEPVPTQHVAVCTDCGVVEGVRAVQQKGKGTGLGAVAGGVLGGVVGHQMGGGKGKTALTVLGAIGGGLAGNEVEKRARATTVYEVRVRMDDGSVRTLQLAKAPTPGEHVIVEGNSLRPAPHRSDDGA
jgi:outer membrane lipoprotein SlyB